MIFVPFQGNLSISKKSSFIFSPNASQNDIEMAKGVFNTPVKYSLGKYLGCPTLYGSRKLPFFELLIEKAT